LLAYFSSSRLPAQGGLVPGDIYASKQSAGGMCGPASLVSELSGTTATATPANDIQPNVRKDGRKLVFSSDR
jgi:WD40-like Beta Propeller Repeat